MTVDISAQQNFAATLKATFPYIGVDAKMRPHIDAIFDGEYDIPGVELHQPIILDIGANVGAYSFWADHRFLLPEIFAFEPESKNIGAYTINVSGVNKCTAHRVAVFPTDAKLLNIYYSTTNCGAHSYDPRLAGQGMTSFYASVWPPRELPDADIIKVDTEGCEMQILSSYFDTHKSRPTIVSFEYHLARDRDLLQELLTPEYELRTFSVATDQRGTQNWLRK